jgi:hypothetical protein
MLVQSRLFSNRRSGYHSTRQRQPCASQHDSLKSEYKSFLDRFRDCGTAAGIEIRGNCKPASLISSAWRSPNKMAGDIER